MVSVRTQDRRKKVCERVRQVRIKQFGDEHGSQKDMAKALGIPYTTYRGYEENRTNDEFIKLLAEKFGVSPLRILWGDDSDWMESQLGDAVVIDPKVGALKSGHYKLIQLADESMEPNLKRGAWVGVEPIDDGEDLNGKLIGFWDDQGKLAVRRAVQKGKTTLGIADNPAFSGQTASIAKKDILGKVVWQFSGM
jgi:transcriptional regulator with XRE-family HTH domain